jgi:DUF917 family protein
MRLIAPDNIEDIALGAAILGTGGGGAPYIGKLLAVEALRQHGPVKLLSPQEVDEESMVVQSAMMGAPTVMVEKLPSGMEVVHAFNAVQAYLGRPLAYATCTEAGGLNSTIPFVVAAHLNIPVIDADGMGRAFPELQMVTPTLHGISATPMALADEKGNSVVLTTTGNVWAERLARAVCIEMGSSALLAGYAMTGRQLKQSMVWGTLTRAEEIGRALREARVAHRDPVAAVLTATSGFEVFRGKVVDIHRRTTGGFARGEARIDGTDHTEGSQLVVRFQNEYLVAERDGELVVTVPDLIAVLDYETGQPVTTDALRYGFRVAVAGIPCDGRWRTPEALELVGPRSFGYDAPYIPVEERFAAPV